MAARRGGRSFPAAITAVAILLAGSLAGVIWLTSVEAPTAAPGARGPVSGPVPRSPHVEPRPSAAARGAPEPVAPLAVVPPVPDPAPEREAPRRPAPAVQVSFKLDPRLTRGLHMGDRWVSPARHDGTGDAKNVSVEARVLDAAGKPLRGGGAEWFASEPDMVEVEPQSGERVRITVWREGESRLTVRAGDVSREIVVKSWRTGGVLRVSFTQ